MICAIREMQGGSTTKDIHVLFLVCSKRDDYKCAILSDW